MVEIRAGTKMAHVNALSRHVGTVVQGGTLQKNDILRRIENLKASLRMAYKELAKANRKAHQNSKRFYDRKAKARHFDVNDLVYLYTTAMKAGLTKKSSESFGQVLTR